MKLKILAIFLVFLVTSALLLFVFGRIDALLFWGIIIFCAIMAYKVIPYLRKKNST